MHHSFMPSMDLELLVIPLIMIAMTRLALAIAEHFDASRLHGKAWHELSWVRKLGEKQITQFCVTLTQIINELIHDNRRELIEHMLPERITQHSVAWIQPQLELAIDTVMDKDHAIIWENLPQPLKSTVYRHAHRQLPYLIDGLVDNVMEQADTLVDINQIVRDKLDSDPHLHNRLHSANARQTLYRFLRYRSLITVLLLSPAVYLLWHLTRSPSMLIALNAAVVVAAIGFPMRQFYKSDNNRKQRKSNPFSQWFDFIRRLSLDKFTLSGQRTQITANYCHIISNQLVDPRSIFHHVFQSNEKSTQRPLPITLLVRKALTPMVDNGWFRSAIQLIYGLSGFLKMKKQLVELILKPRLSPFDDQEFLKVSTGTLSHFLQQRMNELPSEHFRAFVLAMLPMERLKLLAVATIIGLGSGVLQWIVLTTGIIGKI